MLINANALAIPLANKCVHTIVTSPPYYGLRDYGTATWQGGDSDCEHKPDVKPRDERPRNNLTGGLDYMKSKDPVYRDICGKCGAIRIDEQIGLEVTPDAYIANLVEVFRECKRILRDDGTLWVNIGDSYATHGGCKGSKHSHNFRTAEVAEREGIYRAKPYGAQIGLKPKDLIGIPWMLAFALRADGWYLRQDIIWAKPNPMPESVKDRCTKSHEYIFLLSKSARYYYDNEAVKEPVSDVSMKRAEYGWNCDRPSTKNGSMGGDGIHTEKMGTRFVDPAGRNKRDVWTVTTKPYKGAHYATFNPDLIKPCILAGAPEGGIVFDPFVGSGTTVATAIQLGRKGIGLDLSYKYLQENAKVRVEAAELPLLNLIEQY